MDINTIRLSFDEGYVEYGALRDAYPELRPLIDRVENEDRAAVARAMAYRNALDTARIKLEELMRRYADDEDMVERIDDVWATVNDALDLVID